MANEYLQDNDLSKIQKAIEDILIPTILEEERILETFQDLEKRNEEEIEKFATFMAYDAVERELYEVVALAVQEACVESVEYNFEPYVDHLLNAIDNNFSEIFTIEFVEEFHAKYPRITVDFSPLGWPDEWFQVVDRVKESKGFGKTEDVSARSRMWAEKIYKTAREGRQLFRKRYKINKDTGEKEEVSRKDITEKYAKKYGETINARLAELSSSRAPFWYFIEYGNAAGGREGEAYPELAVPETPMSRKIETQVENMYSTAYYNYRDRGREILAKLMDKEAYEKKLIEELENYNKEKTLDDFVEGVRKTYKVVDGYYDTFITSTGKPAVSGRAKSGRFAAAPQHIKDAIEEARRNL